MAGRRFNGENSVYKSGGRWHVQGYINGRRQRVSRATRSDALEAWNARVGVAAAPAPSRAPGQGGTVGHAVKEWLDQAQQGLSPSTSQGYHHALRAHIQPSLGDLPLSGLTVEAIERWQHALLSGRGGRRPLSPSTVHQARVVLKQALDQQVRYGHLSANPVTLARSLPKSRAATGALTAEEARAVIQAADTPQLKARWLLGLTLGLRCGEVLGLRWADLTLTRPEPRLVVAGALKYRAGVGLVLEGTKTNSSQRSILLSPQHVAALKAVQRQQQIDRMASAEEFNPAGVVFVTSRGTPIDPNNDAKSWHRLLAKAKVRKVRRHDARHTAATLLLKDGTAVQLVQRLLGHSSISTTVDVYGHVIAADCANATSKLVTALTS